MKWGICPHMRIGRPGNIRDKMGAIPNATMIPRIAATELTAKSEKREWRFPKRPRKGQATTPASVGLPCRSLKPERLLRPGRRQNAQTVLEPQFRDAKYQEPMIARRSARLPHIRQLERQAAKGRNTCYIEWRSAPARYSICRSLNQHDRKSLGNNF